VTGCHSTGKPIGQSTGLQSRYSPRARPRDECPKANKQFIEHICEYDNWSISREFLHAFPELSGEYVSTIDVAMYIGFGHGMHACPGRFFAGNELKVALAHLLLKYDWKMPEGESKRRSQ